MISFKHHSVTIHTTPKACVIVTLFTVLVTKEEDVFLVQSEDLESTLMTDLLTLLKLQYLVLKIRSSFQEQQILTQ